MKATRLRERLEKKLVELEGLESLKEQAIASGGVVEWESRGGDNTTSIKTISLAEIMSLIKECEKDIDKLEDRIELLEMRGNNDAFYLRGKW